jgi:Ca2+-binding RTX toxin-like protein
LVLNPDVATVVDAGAFSSGQQHYIQNGQFEDNRTAVFSGTSGNDPITGFGKNTNITGVNVEDPTLNPDGRLDFMTNFGVGEVDTLIGGAGRDLFVLGAPTPFSALAPTVPSPKKFYEGGGSADYALIRNFERGKDAIQLAGYALTLGYQLQVVNGSLNISTSSGDLIGIVEGITSPLSQLPFADDYIPATIQIG